MNVTIDGTQIEIFDTDKNIVDVADRAKITIPTPCYNANRKKGCCKVCLVEIDGENQYACGTKPLNGMDIIVKREDLNQIRKERMKAYKENQNNPVGSCGCDCSGDTESTEKNSCCS